MARITAVIDIGSNSARMVVFERTSRYGFHLLHEVKSKVRISEGVYEHGGNLQDAAIARAVAALRDFLSIARSYQARKILCVATSAVRDAPNRNDFLSRVKKELGLAIRVIDGERESYYGAVAAVNLLPISDAVTVDIGGGSTELALIRDKRIVSTVSLPLGTVRLKELFFDRSAVKKAQKFIDEQIATLPALFTSATLVAIGGTNRAIAQAIMADTKYPIDTVHGFGYPAREKLRYTDKILAAENDNELKKLKIKTERYDVIREGAMIIRAVIAAIGAKEIIVSGAGVREGVFLGDILGKTPHFPPAVNPSVRSLIDRFGGESPTSRYLKKTASTLFDVLSPLHRLDRRYREYVTTAAALSDIGGRLNFYNKSTHAFYFIIANLNYGYTHTEKLLIANIIKYGKNKSQKEGIFKKFKDFPLPDHPLTWCHFILATAQALAAARTSPDIACRLDGKNLVIAPVKPASRLIRESVEKLVLPFPLESLTLF